jgi:hypothetical protein
MKHTATSSTNLRTAFPGSWIILLYAIGHRNDSVGI